MEMVLDYYIVTSNRQMRKASVLITLIKPFGDLPFLFNQPCKTRSISAKCIENPVTGITKSRNNKLVFVQIIVDRTSVNIDL